MPPTATTQETLTSLSRRPAIPLAFALLLGILLHPLLPLHPLLLIASLAILAAGSVIAFSKNRISIALIILAVVLSGIALAQREHFQFSSADIALFTSADAHLADLEFRIEDEPRLIPSPLQQLRKLPSKQVMTADVLRIKTWDGWTDATGELPVCVDVQDNALHAGQTIRALGMLQQPSPAANPGQFDWAYYYRQKRILASFTITRLANIAILRPPRFSPITWLRTKTRQLLADGFTAEHEIDHAILAALLLGDRDPALQSAQEEFQKTGIAFQLTVSGLHIALLAGFVLLLCHLALLRPRTSLFVSEAFVLLYAAVSLPSHSGIRSVILCTAFFLARLTHRRTERFQTLAICLLAMLLYHPLDLYSLGFQLSFAAVLGLALYFPHWRALASIQNIHDALAPRKTPTFRTAVYLKAKSLVRDFTIMMMVTWIWILPLILYHIGQLNPWSILASLLVLPLVVVALILGLLKIILTALLPIFAHSLATLAGVPIVALRSIVQLLEHLPGSQIAMPAPPISFIILYYILLLLPLIPPLPRITPRRRWCLRCAPLGGISAVLFFPLFQLTRPAGELRITLLSLGAGQCAIIQPPGADPLVFDAGSSSISELTSKIIAPFLRFQGDRRIQEIFLSHGDYDHISAASELAIDYSVHDLFISPHFIPNAAGNLPDHQLLDSLDTLHLKPRIIKAGDHFELPGGARIDVLWPPPEGNWNSNNAGLVLRLSYAHRTILFPADIQDPAFLPLLHHPEQLKADILIAPHHGSSEILTPQFLHAVAPRIILSSNAWNLTNKQKRFDTMAADIPLYRTSACGAITVTISANGNTSVDTFLQTKPRFEMPASEN